uniref:Uncharacterized protein n=1 Tax=Panagrolaimus sp. PS1159 TaxID=55785 RepID=A0AC35FMD4_9BILA
MNAFFLNTCTFSLVYILRVAYSNDKDYQQQLINKQNDGIVASDFEDGIQSIKHGIQESAKEFKNGVKEVFEAIGDKISPKS